MGERHSLTSGNYKKQILHMSVGMIFGMIGMTIFNMADTIFVGRLGKEQMAALSFTFPIVILVQSLALGLGMGLSVHLSTTLGEKQYSKASRVTTDGLLLAFFLVLIVSFMGRLTIEPLFTLMGAEGVVLEHINSYMKIWYFGSVMVVIPMVGNNAIRATGDTKTPSLIMLISASVNILLDPLLIFGIGPFPSLGVRGAALATVIARSISMTSALLILRKREKLLTWEMPSVSDFIINSKAILFIGIPTALVRMITPLASAIITSMMAGFGAEAVAGFGAGMKIERFALAFTIAIGTAIGPFIGQNLGARNYDRVIKGSTFANKLSLTSGVLIYILLFILSKPLSLLFSPDEEVQRIILTYLRLVGIGYGMQGLFLNCNTILNVLKKPIQGALLSLFQMFILYIPLASMASHHFGEKGVFLAKALSYVISGILALKVIHHYLPSMKE